MGSTPETQDNTHGAVPPPEDVPERPCLVLVFSSGTPRLTAFALDRGELEIGRAESGALTDGRLSRRHGRVRFDGARWHVTDLDSRNGTFLDGAPVRATVTHDAPRVIRMGDSLFIPVRDGGPFLHASAPTSEGPVVGPTLARAWRSIAHIAKVSDTLHVTGESGAGKELAARVFHDATPERTGSFVAVNCATIPEGVAERLLFGARKGAFSGADADADGYVQSAHGGTLFLDELAELSLAVQAKLLRVLESREVMALGATRTRRVDLRVVSATHRDLRAQVADGKLREDLYFRIGRPAVALPALRDRLEEIPWYIVRALRGVSGDLAPHVSLIEECLLRHWPGNVRELIAEVRTAAVEAASAERKVVEARHLARTAGQRFTPEAPSEAPRPPAGPPDVDTIRRALRESDGNISAAARSLSLHRTQFRRFMERYGLIAPPDKGGDE